MKSTFVQIFLFSTFLIQLGFAQFNTEGYTKFDFEEDMTNIAGSVFKYENKQITQQNLYSLEIQRKLTNIYYYKLQLILKKTKVKIDNNTKINLQNELNNKIYDLFDGMRACWKDYNDKMKIPFAEKYYLLKTMYHNSISYKKYFKKQCEYWTEKMLGKISLNECLQLKESVLTKIVKNFEQLALNLKKLLMEASMDLRRQKKECKEKAIETLDAYMANNQRIKSLLETK